MQADDFAFQPIANVNQLYEQKIQITNQTKAQL